jgi:hypothetical protein
MRPEGVSPPVVCCHDPRPMGAAVVPRGRVLGALYRTGKSITWGYCRFVTPRRLGSRPIVYGTCRLRHSEDGFDRSSSPPAHRIVMEDRCTRSRRSSSQQAGNVKNLLLDGIFTQSRPHTLISKSSSHSEVPHPESISSHRQIALTTALIALRTAVQEKVRLLALPHNP